MNTAISNVLLFSICAFAPLVLCVGCNKGPSLVPASGKVLIDGEPLKIGSIIFAPETGRSSYGRIDENGKFTLSCRGVNDGVAIGNHIVQVMASDRINATTIKWYAPKKYAELSTSGLSQKVKEATDSIIINLTWKGNIPSKPFNEYVEGGGEERPKSKGSTSAK